MPYIIYLHLFLLGNLDLTQGDHVCICFQRWLYSYSLCLMPNKIMLCYVMLYFLDVGKGMGTDAGQSPKLLMPKTCPPSPPHAHTSRPIIIFSINYIDLHISATCMLVMRNRLFAYAKTETQISCISAFVSSIRIVQSLCYRSPKLQASSPLL